MLKVEVLNCTIGVTEGLEENLWSPQNILEKKISNFLETNPMDVRHVVPMQVQGSPFLYFFYEPLPVIFEEVEGSPKIAKSLDDCKTAHTRA